MLAEHMGKFNSRRFSLPLNKKQVLVATFLTKRQNEKGRVNMNVKRKKKAMGD